MGEEDTWSKERLQEEVIGARKKESLFLLILMLQLSVGMPLIYISSRITSSAMLDRIGIWLGFIFEILMFLPMLASMYGYEYYRRRYEKYKTRL